MCLEMYLLGCLHSYAPANHQFSRIDVQSQLDMSEINTPDPLLYRTKSPGILMSSCKVNLVSQIYRKYLLSRIYKINQILAIQHIKLEL